MATIVNTMEEEPMLAVVRSTAQLAWADAGAEVADPEVARLCAEAQQHVLAGRWLDMASLMLASADLLLLSPSAPNKGQASPPLSLLRPLLAESLLAYPMLLCVAADLECILTVICNLVTKVGSEDEALGIAKLICAKLTHQLGEKPTL
uniref:Uncharacterized protein n=1 Tax=Triticum urartu TaxID=4572 RepID=A0A8R7QCM8_TRIUA